MLRTGVELRVERSDRTHKVEHVYAIDWDHPEDNVFLAVNQLPISGANNRRPDIIIYVNGLPLVLFELKNPYSIAPSEEEALNQIQHYTTPESVRAMEVDRRRAHRAGHHRFNARSCRRTVFRRSVSCPKKGASRCSSSRTPFAARCRRARLEFCSIKIYILTILNPCAC